MRLEFNRCFNHQNSIKMKRNHDKLLGIIAGILLLLNCSLANSATLKFTYTSDTDGLVGFFTINESIFNQKLISTNWLKNEYIEDLSFSFRGNVWELDSVDKKAYTIFYQVNGKPLPQVQGGSGALAGYNYPQTSIILYADGFVNFADHILVPGSWSTSYVAEVPEPESYTLLLGGLILVGAYSRVKQLR